MPWNIMIGWRQGVMTYILYIRPANTPLDIYFFWFLNSQNTLILIYVQMVLTRCKGRKIWILYNNKYMYSISWIIKVFIIILFYFIKLKAECQIKYPLCGYYTLIYKVIILKAELADLRFMQPHKHLQDEKNGTCIFVKNLEICTLWKKGY